MSSPSQYTPINGNENSVPLTSIRSVDVRPSSSSSRPPPRAQSTNRPLSSQEIQSFLTPPIIIESEKPRMGALAIGVLSVICCIVGLALLSQTKSESEAQHGNGTGSSSTNTSTIDDPTPTSSHGYQLVGLFSLLLGIFSGIAFLLLLLSKSGKLKIPNCIDQLLA